MLADADAAIIVIGDTEKSDAWIEDCSIAMILMQLEATELGIGSCWVQCRGRTTPQGTGTEDRIKSLFGTWISIGLLFCILMPPYKLL